MESASTSRRMVRVETSNSVARSPAVTFLRVCKRKIMAINRSARMIFFCLTGVFESLHDKRCHPNQCTLCRTEKQYVRRRFSMVKAITGHIDLDDGKLSYEMAGDGDTLVLG